MPSDLTPRAVAVLVALRGVPRGLTQIVNLLGEAALPRGRAGVLALLDVMVADALIRRLTGGRLQPAWELADAGVAWLEVRGLGRITPPAPRPPRVTPAPAPRPLRGK